MKLITQSDLGCLSQVQHPGHVQLFEFSKIIPDISKQLAKENRYYHIFAKWKKINISNESLIHALSKINFLYIKSLIDNHGFGATTLTKHQSLVYTESDNFAMDLGYVFAFAKYLSVHECIPSESEYVKFWFSENDRCVNREISLDHSSSYNSIALIMDNALKENDMFFEGKIKFSFDQSSIAQRIIDGFSYRAKKSYAAIIREFFSLYWACAELPNMSPPPSIWWHPVLDVALKADGLALAPHDQSMTFAVDIYLKSSNSNHNIQRKAQNAAFENFTELSIPMSNNSGQIFFPDNMSISRLRNSIAQNKGIKGLYHAAMHNK